MMVVHVLTEADATACPEGGAGIFGSRTRPCLRHAPPPPAARCPPSHRARERRVIDLTARCALRTARSDCARSVGQCSAPGSGLQIGQHLTAVADSEHQPVAAKIAREHSSDRIVIQDALGPAAAAAEHIAVRETATGGRARENPERCSDLRADRSCARRPAANPARSKAAAISICPLTPCSRSTAIRVDLPIAEDSWRAHSKAPGSKVNWAGMPGSDPASMAANSSIRADPDCPGDAAS